MLSCTCTVCLVVHHVHLRAPQHDATQDEKKRSVLLTTYCRYNARSSSHGGASRPIGRRWRRHLPPWLRRPVQLPPAPLPARRAPRASYSVHVHCRRCDDHDYAGPSPRRPPRPSTTSRRWDDDFSLSSPIMSRIPGVPDLVSSMILNVASLNLLDEKILMLFWCLFKFLWSNKEFVYSSIWCFWNCVLVS